MVANESTRAHRFVANDIGRVSGRGRQVRARAPSESGHAHQVRADAGAEREVRARAPSESGGRAHQVRADAGAK